MSCDPQPLDPYRSPTDPSLLDQLGTSERKHAPLGIASFIIGLLGGAAACGLMIMATMLAYAASEAGGEMSDDSAEALAVGLGLLAIVGFSLLGLVLGIVGTFQVSRSKTFAILGILFNALVMLGFCCLMGLGAVVG